MVVLTDWELFKSLDYKRIFVNLRKPAFLFDGRNCLPHQNLYDMGYNVYPIGKPPKVHFD